MADAPSLALIEVAIAKARAEFDAKADELLAAFRHGNVARIGNAAHDAWLAGMSLLDRISEAENAAYEIDSAEWDAKLERARA